MHILQFLKTLFFRHQNTSHKTNQRNRRKSSHKQKAIIKKQVKKAVDTKSSTTTAPGQSPGFIKTRKNTIAGGQSAQADPFPMDQPLKSSLINKTLPSDDSHELPDSKVTSVSVQEKGDFLNSAAPPLDTRTDQTGSIDKTDLFSNQTNRIGISSVPDEGQNGDAHSLNNDPLAEKASAFHICQSMDGKPDGYLENNSLRTHYILDHNRWRRDKHHLWLLFHFPPAPDVIYAHWVPFGYLENSTLRNHAILHKKAWDNDRRMLSQLFHYPPAPDVIYAHWVPFGFLENSTLRNHAMLHKKAWDNDRRTLSRLFLYPPVPPVIYTHWIPFGYLENSTLRNHAMLHKKTWNNDRRSLSRLFHYPPGPAVIYAHWTPFGYLENSTLRNHARLHKKAWDNDRRTLSRLFHYPPGPDLVYAHWTPFGFLENRTLRNHAVLNRNIWRNDQRLLWWLFHYPPAPDVIRSHWSPWGYLENKTLRVHQVMNRKIWRQNQRIIWLLLHYPPVPDVIYAEGLSDPLPSASPFITEMDSIDPKTIDPDMVDPKNDQEKQLDGTDKTPTAKPSDPHSEVNPSSAPINEEILPDPKESLDDVLKKNLSKLVIKPYVPSSQKYLEECSNLDLMQIQSGGDPESDSYWTHLFRNHALIGCADVPAIKVKEALWRAECLLTGAVRGHIQLDLPCKEVICFAVIEYAKNWEHSIQSKFWDYMLGQFSMLSKENRTDKQAQNAKYIALMKSAVVEALDLNHRLVVRTTRQTQYKATVLVHSLGQKQLWFEAYTFMYEYLMYLRSGIYTGSEEDLSELRNLVYGLKEFISRTSDEMSVEIAKKNFVFPIALRKLIVLQPEYTIQMMSNCLLKICSLMARDTCSTHLSKRENEFIEEWYRRLLTRLRKAPGPYSSKSPKPSDPGYTRTEHTMTNARFSYRLDPDQGLILSVEGAKSALPYDDLFIQLLWNDTEIYQAPLTWYSQDNLYRIGKIEIPLTRLISHTGTARLKAQVIDYDHVIQDTESLLEREYWFFKDGKEISIAGEIPDGLILVVPSNMAVQEELMTSELLDLPLPCGYEARLFHTDRTSRLKIGTMCFGSGKLSADDLQIHLSDSMKNLPSLHTPDRIYPTALIRQHLEITTTRTSPERTIKVFVNDTEIDLSQRKAKDSPSEERRLQIPFQEDINHFCTIQIVDLIKHKSVYQETYFILKSLIYDFSKTYYFTSAEMKTGYLIVYLNGKRIPIPLVNKKKTVDIEIKNDRLRFAIPIVQITTPDEEWVWEKEQEIFIHDIPESALLQINQPKGIETGIRLNKGETYFSKNNQILIGNLIHSMKDQWSGLKEIPVELQVSDSKKETAYLLGKICCKAHFKSEPSFVYQDHKIFWMGSREYIGPVPKKLELQMTNGSDSICIPMTMETEFIELPEDLPAGHYEYTLVLITGKVFKTKKEICCSGSIAIGSPYELRFLGKQIKLQKIKSLDYRKGELLSVYNWYIDDIHYLGMATDNEEDGTLHFYEGSLYTLKNNRKVYMSDTWSRNDKGEMTKINPVRLGMVNDSTLIMTNDEQDGIYMQIYPANKKRKACGTINRYEPHKPVPWLKLLDYVLYDVVESDSD